MTTPYPCHTAPFAPTEFRFRIEHAQVVSPGAFQRFHSLGVIGMHFGEPFSVHLVENQTVPMLGEVQIVKV